MDPSTATSCTAFAGTLRIESGDVVRVAAAVRRYLDADAHATILVFDDETARPVEIDMRGSVEDVVARLAPPADAVEAPRGPGRPKLGVVGKEVTLLPRHWEWLATQPGGASVTLRKLVEEARRSRAGDDRKRLAQDAAYRFMTAIGGDLPGYEEATRALFASDAAQFAAVTAEWPEDVREHAAMLAAPAFD